MASLLSRVSFIILCKLYVFVANEYIYIYSDANIIADNFAHFFLHCCSASSVARAAELFADFTSMRENYCGSAPNDVHEFSVELVSNIIFKLKCGKAAGLGSLTAEHLVHCHPSLSCILSKQFNLMLCYGYLPREFGQVILFLYLKLMTVVRSLLCVQISEELQ